MDSAESDDYDDVMNILLEEFSNRISNQMANVDSNIGIFGWV